MKMILALICSFSKIGLVSLGGGNSMLKLLEYEAVTYRHWLAPEEFVSMVGASFLFPGLTAVKLAAFIGYKIAGMIGLLLAITCLNLPGLLLALVGYQWLNNHSTPITQKLMIIVQYGALSLLVAASFSIAKDVINTNYSFPLLFTCILFFLALAFLNVSPFWGLIGFIGICFFIL